MAISLQIGLKQSQKLVMTQSLKQAIELLQLSTIELYERISQEIVENPVIEEDNQTAASISFGESSLTSKVDLNLSGDETVFNRGDEQEIKYSDTSDTGYINEVDDKKRNYIENLFAHEETLNEHLLWQARLSAKNIIDLNIYQSIITSLDENGFLAQDPSLFAKDYNVDINVVNKIISTIQLFDPVGCAVKDVKESLIVQSKHFYPDDSMLLNIITDYFIDLEKLNYEKIAKALNISINTVLEKSKIIQGLDPFPGRQYSTKKIRYIVPDIEVKVVDGEIIINLNDDWLPNIRINSYYIDVLKKKDIEKNLRDYIQDKVQSAKYLIKNISSRRDTIRKVVMSIMEHQMSFLLKGPGNLKPLTHLDIAEEIGMHESTVSRVTTNKFVQTSWGVFELKYFFVTRLKSNNSNDEKSSDQVMSLIKDIVEHEKSENPFSDEEIVALLKNTGVDIARRTVAKYRGILHIPSSNKRKKINMIK